MASVDGPARDSGRSAGSATRVVHRTCTLCEACCGIDVRIAGARIAAIAGDPLDPSSRGYVCAKAAALQDLHEDPDRLRQPIRRTARGWESVDWKTALSFAAERLSTLQRAHGNDAVAIYWGEPVVHDLGALLFKDTLVAALGTSKRFSANSLDQLPRQLASHWIYGSGLLVSVPDVDRTDHLLVLGANPVVSNGSLLTAPDLPARLRRIRGRGGKLVVVDPRRTETARLADEHHFIRPGTDPWLLAALLHVLFAEGRIRLGALAGFADGLEDVRRAVADLAPEVVAERVGIAPDAIRTMAREFSDAPRAVCYGRMGVNTVPFGTVSSWLVEVLNIASGNLDRPGGAMFPRPPVDVIALQPRTERGRWRSRVRGTPEFMGELPTATLAEEIETPGDGQIRALVSLAGNPVLSSPAGHRLSAMLGRLDFMVAIDCYLNETTRHAHLILPPVGPLEREHFDVAFHLFAARNAAHWSPAAFDAPPDARSDGAILLTLAHRLYRARGGLGRLRAAGLGALLALGSERTARVALDLALRAGPYGSGLRPWREGLSLARLRRAAHGIDLGPLEPCMPDRLPARPGGRKRIDLAPHEIVADLERLRRGSASRPLGLVLVGRREARTVNSWSHNLPRLVTGPSRCVLLMHPADAAARGIEADTVVQVSSRVGAVEVPVRLTAEMMRGVVSLPHGYGHRGAGLQLRVATAHAGASINDLTDPAEIDPLSGNAVLNGIPVHVAPCPTSSRSG